MYTSTVRMHDMNLCVLSRLNLTFSTDMNKQLMNQYMAVHLVLVTRTHTVCTMYTCAMAGVSFWASHTHEHSTLTYTGEWWENTGKSLLIGQ